MSPYRRPRRPRLLPLSALALAACVETRTEGPALDPPDVVISAPAEALEASVAGRPVGRVLRFEPTDPTVGDWFSVRDAYDRELGMIDALGRAWRYRPHQQQADLLGAGTIEEGVARILDEERVRLSGAD